MIGLRQRPASRPPSRLVIVASTLAALGLAVGLAWFAFVAPRGVPGVKYYNLEAEFTNAANIGVGSEVRLAGRRVGQVTQTRLDSGRATLKLQLSDSVRPLRSDTRARVALKGALGARFVELTPGQRGRPLDSGETLGTRQTSSAVELLDVAQALDPPRRRQLQRTVRGLGAGFLGRGQDMNELLGTAPRVFRQTSRWTGAVLSRKGAAARFNPSVESAAAAFDPVREEAAQGLRPGARVMEAFADRREPLRQTLEEAPPALGALRKGLDASTPLLDETAGLARATIRLNRHAPGALRQASALLHDARRPLRQSEPLLRSLGGAVQPTLNALDRVEPLVEPSIRSMRNGRVQLVVLGRRPCELFQFMRNWRSMLGFGIAPGSGDPLGDLDEDLGLGALNSLRTVAITPRTTDSISADGPALPVNIPPLGVGPSLPTGFPGINAYPAPCQAWKDRLR